MSFRVHRVSDDEPEEQPSRRWASWVVPLLTAAKPVMAWCRAIRKQHEEEHRKARRVAILKKILLVVLSLFLACVLLVGVARALIGLRILSLEGIFSAAGSELMADSGGATNVLLLGSGDESHSGKDLTDTIMVVSIDPETKSATMLSIPRDLYVLDTENMGEGRINSLYRDYKGYIRREQDLEEVPASLQALKELGAEIGRQIGVDIHYVAKIDFIGFVQAVDELGGVDIDVPYDIVDREYPGPNYSYETFEITEGPHHLDGETALKYVRSRHTTSDFGRSARQQQLLKALAAKVQADGMLKNAGRITSLLGIISDHSQTTMSTREVISLASLAMKIDTNNILSMQLNDRNGLYGGVAEPGGFLYNPPRDYFQGASVLLPVSIPENPITWRQVQSFLDLLQNERAIYAARPRIHVLNTGAKAGLGRKLADELTRYGFDVVETANGENRDSPTSLVGAGKEFETLGTFFGTLLDMPVTLDPGLLSNDVYIYIGENYAYAPIQDLYEPPAPPAASSSASSDANAL